MHEDRLIVRRPVRESHFGGLARSYSHFFTGGHDLQTLFPKPSDGGTSHPVSLHCFLLSACWWPSWCEKAMTTTTTTTQGLRQAVLCLPPRGLKRSQQSTWGSFNKLIFRTKTPLIQQIDQGKITLYKARAPTLQANPNVLIFP